MAIYKHAKGKSAISSRSYCFVLAIALLLSGRACTAGKITVDPNAGTVAAKVEDASVDSRLAQKVTYEAWHTPVKTILSDLSEKTGVTLKAGFTKSDWQARDRKMNIFVKNISLAELMSSIARVMKFKWSINKEKDPPTYRLCLDRIRLATLEAEASKRANELKLEERRRRSQLVEAFANVGDASGAELESLRESNPYLYLCAETGFAKLMTQLFSEKPDLREVFEDAEKNAAPYLSLFSQETQQLCPSVIRKEWSINNAGVDNPRQVPNDLEHQGYEIHMLLLPRPFEWSVRTQLQDLGTISANVSNGDHIIGWLKYPNSESTQSWAEAMLGTVGRKPVPKKDQTPFSTEQDDAQAIEYYLMYDLVEEHPDEPYMQEKLHIKLTDEIRKIRQEQLKAAGDQAAQRIDYQTNLRLISDAAALNVVSDSFSVIIGHLTPADREDEFQKVLDAMTNNYVCNWEKHGSILEIGRRDWFRRRSSQIPDEWVDPWRQEVKDTGKVSLLTYCKMATLTDEQIEENILSDPKLNREIGEWWSYGNNKGFARFYQQLSADQCSSIFTSTGLDANSLSSTQWPYFAEMFYYGRRHAWSTEEFSDPGGNKETIIGTCNVENDGTSRYFFRVRLTKDDGHKKEHYWRIPLPLIEPEK